MEILNATIVYLRSLISLETELMEQRGEHDVELVDR